MPVHPPSFAVYLRGAGEALAVLDDEMQVAAYLAFEKLGRDWVEIVADAPEIAAWAAPHGAERAELPAGEPPAAVSAVAPVRERKSKADSERAPGTGAERKESACHPWLPVRGLGHAPFHRLSRSRSMSAAMRSRCRLRSLPAERNRRPSMRNSGPIRIIRAWVSSLSLS